MSVFVALEKQGVRRKRERKKEIASFILSINKHKTSYFKRFGNHTLYILAD